MGDAVADACTDARRYMGWLEAVVPHRVENGIPVAGTRAYMGVSPDPGNQPAFRALMTLHAGVRRLLASGRLATAGHPGAWIPGSDECTMSVLEQIPRTFAGLDNERRDAAVWFLTRWITGARKAPGIDELNRLRHCPTPRPGEPLPPCCPYCKCYQLVADVELRKVYCTVPDCIDGLGLPPVATMTIDGLMWPDGLVEPGLAGLPEPELEDADLELPAAEFSATAPQATPPPRYPRSPSRR